VDWPDSHDAAAGLPAPRDDEPQALRQDIADELADHLRCALQRELLVISDEQQAKRNVLSRFGNVERVGRKLWFDQMREKIMSQRITLAMFVMTAVACITVSGLAWQTAQQSQQLSAAMLEKLATVSARTPPQPVVAESTEWSPVKLQLVLGRKGGLPAEGFQVNIKGDPYGRKDTSKGAYDEIGLMTDSEGIADFGQIRTGQYRLGVSTPWGDYLESTLFVPRGRPLVKEIVCPAGLSTYDDVQLEINWPQDLRDKGLWAVCAFSRSQDPLVADGTSLLAAGMMRWTLNTKYPRNHVVIFTAAGKCIDSPRGMDLVWTDSSNGEGYQTDYLANYVGRSIENFNQLSLKRNSYPGYSEPTLKVRRIPRNHFLTGIEIALPSRDVKNFAKEPSFRIIGRHPFCDPDEVEMVFRAGEDIPMFEVKSGVENRWTITLPEELLKQVRTHLAADSDATPRT